MEQVAAHPKLRRYIPIEHRQDPDGVRAANAPAADEHPLPHHQQGPRRRHAGRGDRTVAHITDEAERGDRMGGGVPQVPAHVCDDQCSRHPPALLPRAAECTAVARAGIPVHAVDGTRSELGFAGGGGAHGVQGGGRTALDLSSACVFDVHAG